MKIFIVAAVCLILSGCGGTQLKEGGLYVSQSTSVGMDDLGVAKVRSQF
ncbi:MAG: hypothetical protein Q8R38_04150 [Candidatus Omnitrophota bacterium]|nr:hypothetical protein [Candidatus Omnitrophota bacterium]